ncbi:MAG: hypothetical protein IT385_21460 [Deltaproteobacteria bacterium]|nr:hypothetical protein [Deltaproteobacteria bacterium]
MVKLLAHFAVGLALAVVSGVSANAQEPRGNWGFAEADKPVKVIVLGGSVSAYGLGGYSQWLPSACARIEVKNIAKAKLGASALKDRFVAQVLKNKKVDPKAAETWLLFLGGLNSIGMPEQTNVDVAATLRMAFEAGFRTMGITVNPWGSEGDHRWKGAGGLAYAEHTKKAVDFVMGRLTPEQAFGKAGEGRTAYLPGELPEIGVDLWDSPLRHKDAAPRAEKPTLHSVKTSAWVKQRLKDLDGEAREQALASFVTAARELPRWFMRPELIGFDAIHPNAAGHKEIARQICLRAPASWGCSCDVFDGLAWDPRARKPVPL